MICLALIVSGTFGLLFGFGSRDDEWNIALSKKAKRVVGVLCTAQAVYIVGRLGDIPMSEQSLLGVLAGCLLTACAMDLKAQAVCRYVWKVGGGASCLLLMPRVLSDWQAGGVESMVYLVGLILYLLIQHGVFGRLYGRADCFAFCVCATAQTALGGGFSDYVIHMAAAFLGLTLVQTIRKNIAIDGNLRVPVPFLPYITVSFWLWLDFAARKWYI